MRKNNKNRFKQIKNLLFICIVSVTFIMCTNSKKQTHFQRDKEFLSENLKIIELKNGDASILISPEYQARVMTSTCGDEKGLSLGWINYDAIKSDEVNPQFNPYGGEERFWIGPEGGQYSVFFEKGEAFEFKNWNVPPAIDTEPFELISKSEKEAKFKRQMSLVNYSGFKFDFLVNRDIRLLSKDGAAKVLSSDIPANLEYVAYQTENKITNTSQSNWTKETGTISIWLLGMMAPSDQLTVVTPVADGDLGYKVNDNYFGEIPDSELKTIGNTVFFKGNGKRRGKIGISHQRSLGLIGSYDAKNKVLTIVHYNKPTDRTDYVNSSWELQENPYAGDAINSYNDGPLEDGSQLGPFYEIETSSPAADLKAGEAITHTQSTMHFMGDENELNTLSKKVLGVSLQEINDAL